MLGGDLGELGISAVAAVGQLGRAEDQLVLDGDDLEGLGPEPAHPGENFVLDEVDLRPVRRRPLRFEGRRVEAYAHRFEDAVAVAVAVEFLLQAPCCWCSFRCIVTVAVSVRLGVRVILVTHDVVGVALDAGAPIVGRFRLNLVQLPPDRGVVFAVQPSNGVHPPGLGIAGRRGGPPKGAAAAGAGAGGGIRASQKCVCRSGGGDRWVAAATAAARGQNRRRRQDTTRPPSHRSSAAHGWLALVADCVSRICSHHVSVPLNAWRHLPPTAVVSADFIDRISRSEWQARKTRERAANRHEAKPASQAVRSTSLHVDLLVESYNVGSIGT